MVNGGAVKITNADVGQVAFSQVLISSHFTNNYANKGGAVAITPFQCNLTVHDSSFLQNTAASQGGGIEVQSAAITRNSNTNVTLLDTTFEDNDAKRIGGGMLVAGVSNMSIQSATFTNNTANTGAGLAVSSICTSQGSKLERSAAFDTQQRACSIAVTDSIFTDNTAAYGGGAIVRADGYESVWVNTNFTNNHAESQAGGLAYSQVTEGGSGSLVLMADMLFSNNSVSGTTDSDSSLSASAVGAGGLWVDALLCLAIVRSTFDLNIGTPYWGAMAGAMVVSRLNGAPDLCYQQSQHHLPNALTLTPPVFNPGPQSEADSTLSFSYTPTAMDFRSNHFTNNTGSNGGAMYIYQSNKNNMTISDSRFSNNTSLPESGGSIYASLPPDMYIRDCLFEHGVAYADGGALWVANARLTIKRSSMQDCTALTSGGAIAAVSGSMIAVFDSDFTLNDAGTQGGGAISCVACELALFNNTLFANNTSLDVGGALRADADTKAVAMQYVQAIGNR